MEKNLKKNIYIHTNTLQYTLNQHNIVNKLYFNLKNRLENKNWDHYDQIDFI